MFVIDMPYVPVQEPAAIEMQLAASEVSHSVPSQDYLVSDCIEVTMTDSPVPHPNDVDPTGMIKIALQRHLGYPYIDTAAQLTMKVDVLEYPNQGTLVVTYQAENGFKIFKYQSEPEFEGKDKASFLVEFEGIRYKIVLDIIVQFAIDEKAPLCDYEHLPTLIEVNKPNS